jgi:hypothetical protein
VLLFEEKIPFAGNEEALTGWLRSEITRIEQQLGKLTDPLLEARVEFSKLAEA